ncbi:MAG TPA: hypothetical protein VFQ87_04540 [Bradyrhizobium sp.]|jgi:hypothetical protein|nr:hypothetical protein [Bradyrhizobium sp.]
MISGTRIALPDSVRLLRLEFDFIEAIAAVNRGERPEAPRVADTCYAIARSRYRVRTHVLQPWQYELLRACAEQGMPLQGAGEHAARGTGQEMGQVWAELLVWLTVALDAGMLTIAGRAGPVQ